MNSGRDKKYVTKNIVNKIMHKEAKMQEQKQETGNKEHIVDESLNKSIKRLKMYCDIPASQYNQELLTNTP